MSKRISQVEYDAFFNEGITAKDNSSAAPDEKEKEGDKKTKKAEALKYALEIRSFEIELYWKRATYFWAFIGATFAGYGAVQASSISPRQDLAVALSCMGLVFSFGWFCVNKGSKQWQENWENHVDLLEDEIIGPLYKIVLGRPKSGGVLEGIACFLFLWLGRTESDEEDGKEIAKKDKEVRQLVAFKRGSRIEPH